MSQIIWLCMLGSHKCLVSFFHFAYMRVGLGGWGGYEHGDATPTFRSQWNKSIGNGLSSWGKEEKRREKRKEMFKKILCFFTNFNGSSAPSTHAFSQGEQANKQVNGSLEYYIEYGIYRNISIWHLSFFFEKIHFPFFSKLNPKKCDFPKTPKNTP